jgi:hypothetical protein
VILSLYTKTIFNIQMKSTILLLAAIVTLSAIAAVATTAILNVESANAKSCFLEIANCHGCATTSIAIDRSDAKCFNP